MENAAEARKHTYVVINHAQDLIAECTDAETSQRGYMLTGKDTFLEPYILVKDEIGRAHV